MRFGGIGIDDIAKVSAVCVGATAATFFIETTGYFKIIGKEFIGIYLDSNLFIGVLHSAPFVFSYICISVTAYYYCLKLFRYLSNDEKSFVDVLLIYDKLLIIPIVVFAFITSNNLIWLKASIFIIASFITWGIVYFQYYHFNVINYINLLFALFTTYNAIFISGQSDAVADLKRTAPLYDVFTDDKNYINTVILRATSAGVLIRWGQDVIFYRDTEIKKIRRSISE